ncbi:uncharacterized protein TRAVEDRAFT_49376 [Trametes versicolor FP-101664 SS1]|uniref:uncharacterized protein n=1 Tax=Trametes versicolor (strain FP-101664) TaxID=717944 RepID=UPI0004624199|nr:uncharacterized protein TRAVEDRAFT_49376 [Trametes versicolor FP-101664 SS1]EIW56553.1 hypothetical protein TRAVEDRAFT_49376 [Trametes versicolor FP-101664 SS1]
MSLINQNAPQVPSLDNTLGVWLIGTFLGTLLQGLVVFQTYRYFCLYPKDPLYLKLWVFAVLILEMLNSALTMHTSYVYLVSNFFNPAILQGPIVRSLAIYPIPAALAGLVSQCFFVRRVYMLGRRFRFLAAITMPCYVLFLGFCTALSIKGLQVANLDEFRKYSWLASAASCVLLVADFLITAVLIRFLRGSRTGLTRTDSLLDTLIIYAVGTGLLIWPISSVFNILNVVFALACPNNLIYTAISMILTKLYANSFLVALNLRDSLGNIGSIGATDTSPFGSTLLRGNRAPGGRTGLGTLRFGFSGPSSEPASAIELKMAPGISRDTTSDVSKGEHHGEEDSAKFVAV